MSALHDALAALVEGDGRSLTDAEAERAIGEVMDGGAHDAVVGAFLIVLKLKGAEAAELAGGVRAMLKRARPLNLRDREVLDTCGTGGDGASTFNISTGAALIAAAAGVPVAKHGNRALSSRSGAADTLVALGVKIDIGPDVIARCIREAGIGFMFAPAHHSAMKHVGPARAELGFRTVFNLIGPLSNPASVKRYLLGVFSPDWVEPLANVLASLGAERAWVVHGHGGLDEISPSGGTKVASLDNGKVVTFTITPDDAGLRRYEVGAIKGGDAAHNAEALRAVLGGMAGAYRDTVLLNAGAALVVAGKAKTLAEGAKLAAAMIDQGKAGERLDRLVAVSNG
jgi:anthranilate phosphoribosyltransferase